MTTKAPLDSNDLAAVYAEARQRYYADKKVGWHNWEEIEEQAHKYALLAVCSNIIDRVREKVL